jgi:hypothetical protein
MFRGERGYLGWVVCIIGMISIEGGVLGRRLLRFVFIYFFIQRGVFDEGGMGNLSS